MTANALNGAALARQACVGAAPGRGRILKAGRALNLRWPEA